MKKLVLMIGGLLICVLLMLAAAVSGDRKPGDGNSCGIDDGGKSGASLQGADDGGKKRSSVDTSD